MDPTDSELLDKYGAEAGGEIIRLLHELKLTKLSGGRAPYWRDCYFQLYDQLSLIADLVDAPRSSNYAGGHVLDAVKKKLH